MSADRHLLFGLLALQNEFIDKRALVAAFGIWVADRGKSLDRILVEQSALTEDLRLLLERLVDQHIRAKGGDIHASLNSLSGEAAVRIELERLADKELQASIMQLKPMDPLATVAVGQSTSQGRRFEIRRPLDRGGLGVVSIAIDKELNREVALKEIRTDCADDTAFRQKFLLEAEVTGGLEHPNIVPVYGLGTYADGRPYYAMRLIQGDNLREHIRLFHQDLKDGRSAFDGPALRKLLRRFMDVCEAIDYAHARGILHRDLKPGNVMLGKYGETLVVDWGLAKAVAKASSEDTPIDPTITHPFHQETPLILSSMNVEATLQGSIVGTAAYAPPEQLSGNLQEVGVRSDVYGLGAILYELQTGRAPGLGKSVEDTIRNVVRGQIPSPRSVHSQIPKPLEAICLKAISLDPIDRYASAGELKQEVERWLDDLPVKAYQEPMSIRVRRSIRSHPAIASTVAAIVLMTTVGLGLFSSVISQSNLRLALLNTNLDAKNAELIESNNRERDVSKELELRRQELERKRLELQLHNACLDCESGRLDIGLATMVSVLRTATQAKNKDIESRVRRLISAWSTDQIFSVPVANAESKVPNDFGLQANFNAISQNGKFLAYSEVLGKQSDSLSKKTTTLSELAPGAFDPDDLASVPQERVRLFELNAKESVTASIAPKCPKLSVSKDFLVKSMRSNIEFLDRLELMAFVDDNELILYSLKDQRTKRIPVPVELITNHETMLLIKFDSPSGRLVVVNGLEIRSLDVASETWAAMNETTLDCREPIAIALTSSGPLRIALANAFGLFMFEPSQQNSLVKVSNAVAYTIDFSSDGSLLYAGGFRSSDQASPLSNGWIEGWDIRNAVKLAQEGKLPTAIGQAQKTVGEVSLVRTIPTSSSILVASGSSIFHDLPSQLQMVSLSSDSLERSIAALNTGAEFIATGHGKVARAEFTSIACTENESTTLWRVGLRTRLLSQSELAGDATCGTFDPSGESLFIGLRPKTPAGLSIEWRNGRTLAANAPITTKQLGLVRAMDYSSKHRQMIWTGASTGTFAPDTKKLTGLSRTASKTQHSCLAMVNDQSELAILVEEDAAWILGGHPVSTVLIVNRSTGETIRKLEIPRTIVRGLAVGPANQLIAGASDHTLRSWDPATGVENETHKPFVAPVQFVVANESSPVYGVVTGDGALHIEHWQKEKKSPMVLQHRSKIATACLSQDGSLVATGCTDGNVQLWDTMTGDRIGGPMPHESTVNALAISADGRILFTGAGNKARTWEIPIAGPEPLDEIAARTELLTGTTVSESGEVIHLTTEERLGRIFSSTPGSKNAIWPEIEAKLIEP